jgi:hypothetical protein
VSISALHSSSPTRSNTKSQSKSKSSAKSQSASRSFSLSESASERISFSVSATPSDSQSSAETNSGSNTKNAILLGPVKITRTSSFSESTSSAPSISRSLTRSASKSLLVITAPFHVHQGNDTIAIIEILTPPSNEGFYIVIPDPIVGPTENSPTIISQIVEISFVTELGEPLDFDGKAKLCFQVNETDSDSCLGYLDESISPPKWKCEDECLDSHQGQLCGSTSHFTSFAILLSGGSGGDCTSNYILGSGWYDLALILSFVVVLWICLCLFVFIVECTPFGNYFFGKEHTRVKQLRSYAIQANREPKSNLLHPSTSTVDSRSSLS